MTTGGRKRALQAQAGQDAEALHRIILASISDAVFITDYDGRFVYVCGNAVNIFGRTDDEIRALPGIAHLLGDPLTTPQALRKTGEIANVECSIVDAHGARHDLLVNIKHVNIQRGSMLYTCRDVTERRQAFDQSAQRAADLQTLVGISRTISALNDPDETLRAIYELIGRVVDNTNFYIALYDKDRATVSFPLAMLGGQVRQLPSRQAANGITEYVIRTRQPLLLAHNTPQALAALGIEAIGQQSASLLAVPMLAGGEAIGVMAVQDFEHPGAYGERERDLLAAFAAQATVALENNRLFQSVQLELAERQRAEAALAESERRYRDTLHNTTLAVLSMDSHGRITFCNRRLLALTGWAAEDVLGRGWFDTFSPPDQRQTYRTDFMARLAGGGEIADGESEIMTRDGQHRLMAWTSIVLRDAHGQPQGASSLGQDVTDQRLLERQHREAEARYRALLSPIAYLREALEIPYCHHEKWHGSGYPNGMVGEQIPLAARIFAVADVWDALSSDRPYRTAWPAERVTAHIRQQAGAHFEPRLAEAFLRLLAEDE